MRRCSASIVVGVSSTARANDTGCFRSCISLLLKQGLCLDLQILICVNLSGFLWNNVETTSHLMQSTLRTSSQPLSNYRLVFSCRWRLCNYQVNIGLFRFSRWGYLTQPAMTQVSFVLLEWLYWHGTGLQLLSRVTLIRLLCPSEIVILAFIFSPRTRFRRGRSGRLYFFHLVN